MSNEAVYFFIGEKIEATPECEMGWYQAGLMLVLVAKHRYLLALVILFRWFEIGLVDKGGGGGVLDIFGFTRLPLSAEGLSK